MIITLSKKMRKKNTLMLIKKNSRRLIMKKGLRESVKNMVIKTAS